MSIRTSAQLDLRWLKDFVLSDLVPFENGSRFKNSDNEFLYLCRILHSQGLLQLVIPKQYGGKEAPVIDLACVFRELGYGSASIGVTCTANTLGLSALVLFAPEKLKREICEQYLAEYGLWSFAMSEADVGSDLTKTRTIARKVDGGYEIAGEKNFISNSSTSNHLSVFARVLDGDKDLGVTCFYMRGDNAGLERGPVLDKMACATSDTGTLYFKNAFVPDDHVMGEIGKGLKVLGRCLNRSKTLLASAGVGLSQRAIDLMCERLASTTRFDKLLLEQPVIRHEIVRLQVDVEAAWLLICRAAEDWDSDRDATKSCCMAKLFAGRVAAHSTSVAVEMFGSRGLTHDFEVSRLYQNAKVFEIIEGPSFIQETLIAREIFPRAKKEEKGSVVSEIRSAQRKAG